MSVHSKIVKFFRKTIAQSGQIIDDDVIYLNTEDWNEKVEKKTDFRWVSVGTVLVGLYSLINSKMEIFYASALISTIPVITPYLVSFYYDVRSKMLKNTLKYLLEEFRQLSRTNADIIDFLNSYKKYLKLSGKAFITLPNNVVLELFLISYRFQCQIMKMLLDILSDIHQGLKDFVFDWNEYEEALSQELEYDTLESCAKNANILDARMILIRSHFWISIYLLCTKNGNPQLLVQIMETKILALLHLMRKSNLNVRDTLDRIRFFDKKCLVVPSLKHIPTIGPGNLIAKMRRHINILNNNICCSLLNVKIISDIIDNEHLDELLDELSQKLSRAEKQIYECYQSTSDLRKNLEVLRRYSQEQYEKVEDKACNIESLVPKDSEESEINIEEPQSEEEEQDQEYEAFITEEPQQESTFVSDDMVNVKISMDQQNQIIRELHNHGLFLQKHQNLCAKSSTPDTSDKSVGPNEIDDRLCLPRRITEGPEYKHNPKLISKDRSMDYVPSIPSLIREATQGDETQRDDSDYIALDLPSLIREATQRDDSNKIPSRFRLREEDTFE